MAENQGGFPSVAEGLRKGDLRLCVPFHQALPNVLSDKLKKEMDQAERLFRDFGGAIQREEGLVHLMDRYREAIGETGRTMEVLGVAAECSACANENPGSCCFEGVEEWYDQRLLFINLLMGCEIPRHREIPGHCLFVGNKGCRLIARYSFCVNYLCGRLKKRLGQTGTAQLLATAGHELGCGWELERDISRWLKGRGVRE